MTGLSERTFLVVGLAGNMIGLTRWAVMVHLTEIRRGDAGFQAAYSQSGTGIRHPARRQHGAQDKRGKRDMTDNKHHPLHKGFFPAL